MKSFKSIFGVLFLSVFMSFLFILVGGCGESEDTDDEQISDEDSSMGGDNCADEDVTNEDVTDGDITDVDETEISDGDVTPDEYGLIWLLIPGGDYQMGCSTNDNECDGNEVPRHSVTVSEFLMTQMEITNSQYAEFLNNNGNDCSTFKCVDSDSNDSKLSFSSDTWSVKSDFENHPVEEVSWYGAKAFCEYVGGRLPSEAEWEYAARAETETVYYCGDEASCFENIICWGEEDTCPVGQFDPNAYGLHDMFGNVWEWNEDCYHAEFDGAPSTSIAWTDENCSDHVLRGGSWCSTRFCGGENNVRSSDRGYQSSDGTTYNDGESLGVRCAKD